MSKRDRQGVRTPADLERKYDFGKLNASQGNSKKQDIAFSELTQKVDQFMVDTNGNIEDINTKIDDINENIDDINNDISGFNGAVSELNNKYTELSNKVDELEENGGGSTPEGDGETSWENVTNKPDTFPPSTHSHSWDNIEQKPNTFPPSEHTHGNKILASPGWVMSANQTVTLSEPISKQPTGIVLVFSRYEDSVQNDNIHTFFISKKEVELFPDNGHSFPMFRGAGNVFKEACVKYLYINDTTITGHSSNDDTSGTGSSGISYNNYRFVLRYVIGV